MVDVLDKRSNSNSEWGQREERFRRFVEAVQDYAIFMLDPRGNVSTWNAGAERIKGYKASEIIGKNFSSFYPDQDVSLRQACNGIESRCAGGPLRR